jgi:hypothetical protein
MYSGNTSSATNDAVINSTEKAPDMDVSEIDPTPMMGVDAVGELEEVEE